MASAAKGAEEEQARNNAYDAFRVEKDAVLRPPKPTQLEQLMASRKTAAAAAAAAASEHDSSSEALDGAVPAVPTSAPIDFSKFGNLDLA